MTSLGHVPRIGLLTDENAEFHRTEFPIGVMFYR